MIGDTIRFTDLERCEIIITGRTKHYLSICGEHLSVDNMNQAMLSAAETHNLEVPEFCVSGFIHEGSFGHQWYIGCDIGIDAEKFRQSLDDALKLLNDDYAVERRSALKTMNLEIIPVALFYDWMRKNGKEGGQNKFPRVLKKEQLADWQAFLRSVRV
jgi:hypothetical protein